jgi:hypothetical protein
MATIRFAVTLCDNVKGYQVEHLYQHYFDAEGCVMAYSSQLHMEALVIEMNPPLTVSRRADAWAIADWNVRRLSVFGSRRAAESALTPGTSLIEAPIRKGMPVQIGVPQFGLCS